MCGCRAGVRGSATTLERFFVFAGQVKNSSPLMPCVPASSCRLIRKEDGVIDWTSPAVEIERKTRAYAPWPSAHTLWNGSVFKIWQADVVEGATAPGCVVQTDAGAAIGTGAGMLLLKTVQPAGKRAMDIKSFLNGAPDFVGSCLA